MSGAECGMGSLCETVGANVDGLLAACGGTDYELSAEAPGKCVLRIGDLEIGFYLDRRDGGVTSTLTFAGAAEDEPLDSHVVARLFGDLPWSERQGAATVAERVAAETENLSRLIARIREQGLSPRDLFYFALGYNSAYTDYYAR